jgi:hypothetical protein
MRWSCGQSGSDTLEVDGTMTGGIVGVSGVHLYKRGVLAGSVPESGEATQEINFVLGAIQTDNNDNYQYMRGTIRKILIVKRRLSDEEQAEIFLNIKNCGKPSGELLDNWTFDCGVAGWFYNPNYPAIITDNNDGSVHLKSTSQFGSLRPLKHQFPSDKYIFNIEVKNVVGSGKISVRSSSGWHNIATFTDGGKVIATYEGVITDINIGANNDDTFECDFLSCSLKVYDERVVKDGEEVTYNNEQVVYNI